MESHSTATAAGAEQDRARRRDPAGSERGAPAPHGPEHAAGVALDDQPASDGRLARGQRTRRNVADALVALLAEGGGEAEPTARTVAQRAGVSLRLVFHHFADMDDLYHYVAALQLRGDWSSLRRLAPHLDLATRVDRTTAQRAALFEKIGPVRRAMARRTSSPGVRQATVAADALLLEDLESTFSPELDALAEPERGERLDAMDTAASWEAWDRIRRTSGLPVGSARRVMARLLLACCGARSDAGSVRSTVGAAPAS